MPENVRKVKNIVTHACSSLVQAARKEESINLADKWCLEPEAQQQEYLRLLRIERGNAPGRTMFATVVRDGMTLTMPMEFRAILQQTRHILHGIPAMGPEAVQQWAKARYGARLIVIVVQQTFSGLLNCAVGVLKLRVANH